MLGYVRPVRDELKVKEWKYYRAAYCGVCDAMGRRMGLTARMFLNYDFTFLAMLLLPPAPRPELPGPAVVPEAGLHRRPPGYGSGG